MAIVAKQLVARFIQNPNIRFSDEDIAALAAVGDRDLMAAKIVALHKFKTDDHAGAVEWCRKVLAREKTEENVKNLGVALRKAGHAAEGAELIATHEKLMSPIVFHDLMCMCLHSAGNDAEARKHGTRSLVLKDENAPKAPEKTGFTIHPVDIETPQRNVIAFSVFGTNQRYLTGAVTNAIAANYLYPGWRTRFYTDAATPQQFRATLAARGAEVVVMPPDLPAQSWGLFWRFLVEDDENVDVYLIRDADSVVSIKERAAVADWLATGKAFHVMRDNVMHSELMLAGMWGAHRGNLGPMRRKVEAFLHRRAKKANDLTADQHFLRTEIWPIVRQNVCIHDSVFDAFSPER